MSIDPTSRNGRSLSNRNAAIVAAMIVVVAAWSAGQTTAPTPPDPTSLKSSPASPSPSPAAPSPSPAKAPPTPLKPPVPSSALAVAPAPSGKLLNPRLMREGSYLVQVKGRLVRDDETGWWRFIVQDDRPQIAGHSFRMLPNTRLGEMERMAESVASSQVLFEVTGEVFTYQSRNYLLATHSPLVSVDAAAAVAAVDRKVGASGASDVAGATGIKPPTPNVTRPPVDAKAAPPDAKSAPAEDSAEDIVAELEQAVGPLARSIDVPAEQQQQDQIETIMREGMMITARRGHMMRDRSGVWLFVFDADASGQNDPPMMLVPCALLERMRQYTTQSTTKAPMLVSGRVFAYRGRNYLLPTVYRIPTERTPLVP